MGNSTLRLSKVLYNKKSNPYVQGFWDCEISGEKLHNNLFDERGGERKLNPSNDSGFKFKQVLPLSLIPVAS